MLFHPNMLSLLACAMAQTADHVMITDQEGTIEYVNHAFELTTGYAASEVIGQNPRILRSGRHGHDYYKKLWSTILDGKIFYARTINKKKDGKQYIADQSITPVRTEVGETYFVAVWKDITERVADEEKIKEAHHLLVLEKKKLEQVLSIEAGLHSISDLNKLIDFVIEKTCEVLGVHKCTVMFVDEESKELCVRGHYGIEESRIGENMLALGGQIEDLIELHRSPGFFLADAKAHGPLTIDGSVYHSDSFMSVPIKIAGHLLGLINVSHKDSDGKQVFNDLDLKMLSLIARQTKVAIENAKLYQNLKYLTVTDHLTGIRNYRYFTQTLDYELMRAKRYQRDLALLMIDIDKFKAYNDAFGHPEGDRLLCAVAQCIKENVRETDELCRYGGDEFIVILPETNLDMAKLTAEKIREKISKLALKRPITASIGVTQCNFQSDRHALVRRVDSALYAAKNRGKNQVYG